MPLTVLVDRDLVEQPVNRQTQVYAIGGDNANF